MHRPATPNVVNESETRWIAPNAKMVPEPAVSVNPVHLAPPSVGLVQPPNVMCTGAKLLFAANFSSEMPVLHSTSVPDNVTSFASTPEAKTVSPVSGNSAGNANAEEAITAPSAHTASTSSPSCLTLFMSKPTPLLDLYIGMLAGPPTTPRATTPQPAPSSRRANRPATLPRRDTRRQGLPPFVSHYHTLPTNATG